MAITGPAGAGKSTIGEALAKSFPKCVNIDADHIKHMIVSGFYKDATDPGGWGFGEWELVGENIGLLARNCMKHGFNVVIHGYIDESAWATIQKMIVIDHKILLLPSMSETVRRDSSRREDAQMGEAAVKKHHAYFSSSAFFDTFIKIDTTNQDVDSTVREVQEIVRPSVVSRAGE